MSALLAAFATIFFILPFLRAESKTSTVQLEERLQHLEATLAEMSKSSYSRQGAVQTFFANSLGLGGYFETSMTSIWGPDTPTQTVADSQRLGINLSADLEPRIRFVGQFSMGLAYAFRNEHNNPDHGSSLVPTRRSFQEISFGSLLSQAFVEHDLESEQRIQFGMGYAPFGRAFQVRDPVLFLRKRGPQLVRTSGITRLVIADPFWKGVRWTGPLNRQKTFTYDLYTNSPLGHSGVLGVGSRLEYTAQKSWKLGQSLQHGFQEQEAYMSTGVDLGWDAETGGFQLELARLRTETAQNDSFYFQLFLRSTNRSWLYFVDVDYLKNPFGQTTLGAAAVNDPYIKWETSVGLNYYLASNAKFRIELTHHDYTGDRALVNTQNRDYSSISASHGVSF